MGLKICLIQASDEYPQFEVAPVKNEGQEVAASRRLVFTIARGSIALLGQVFVALYRASCQTIPASGRLFKEVCIQYSFHRFVFCFVPDLHIIAFKMAVWAANVFLFFGHQVIRNFLEIHAQASPKDLTLYLQRFANQAKNVEIDLSHLAIPKQRVDVSHISQDLTVNHLMTMFEQINIDSPASHGYVKPFNPFSQEEYTREKVKEGLTTFIQNISEGSLLPYSRDSLEEMRNRIRFCMDAIEKRWKEFQINHGNNPAIYQGQVLQTYISLLEEKARLIIECAIIALDKRCITHHENGTLNLYSQYSGDIVNSRGTLKEQLKKILIQERRAVLDEIAFNLEREDPPPSWFDKERVQRNQGQEHSAETHVVMSCLVHCGSLVGLPDVAYDPHAMYIDRAYFLVSFFQCYTPDRIVRAIQRAYKESFSFRNKILEWLMVERDENHWRPLGIQINEPSAEWDQILAQKQVSDDYDKLRHLEQLKTFIQYLKEKDIQLSSDMKEENWNSWWEELCTLDHVKEWLELGCPPSLTQNQRMGYRSGRKTALKELFGGDQLGSQLIQEVIQSLSFDAPFITANFLPRLLDMEKANKLALASGMDLSIAFAVVKKPETLQQRYKAYQQREILDKGFKQALGRHADLEHEITPEVMELLLVKHGILLPQQQELFE